MSKTISYFIGLLAVAALLLSLIGVSTVSAHHNSPMYEMIEENENFDHMGQHEEAIDNLTDNSNMDSATEMGVSNDVATQTGAADGPDGDMAQSRIR